MIRCTRCGTVNPSDASFCSNCNSYLEWFGERLEDEQAGAAPPASEPPGDTGQATSLPGAPDQATPAPPVPHPVPPSASPTAGRAPGPPAPPTPPTAPPAAGSPGSAPAMPGTPPPPATPPAAARQPAAAPTGPMPSAPSEPAEPAPSGPSARRPEAATSHPPARRPEAAATQPPARKPGPTPVTPPARPRTAAPPEPEERPAPGELVCGTCGTGNDPARRFCRRCGASLAEAIVAPPAARGPWYRRSSGPARYQAGERPERMRAGGRWRPGCLSIALVVLVAVVIAAVGVYVAVPQARQAVTDLVDTVRWRIADSTLVHPAAQAPGLGGRRGGLAVDTDLNTWWSADPARRMVLTVTFEDEADLRRINVHSGATKEQYLSEGRPRVIRVLAGERSRQFTLADTSDLQPLTVEIPDVRELQIQIVDTYGPVQSGVAVREFEFEALR